MATIDGLNRLINKLDDEKFEKKLISGLNKACRVVEREARVNCPRKTGNLKRSITHEVKREGWSLDGYVGTNVEYAPYVEYGTGKFAENGNGRKTPWSYADEKTGETIWTAGQKPQPFLRPALINTSTRVKNILDDTLREILEK